MKLSGDHRNRFIEVQFAKQSGLCYLCGEVMDFAYRSTKFTAASIDHVHPISKGGTWGKYNLRLAHVLCNHIKDDIVIPIVLIEDENFLHSLFRDLKMKKGKKGQHVRLSEKELKSQRILRCTK